MPSNQLPEDVRAGARKVAHLAVENALVEMRDSRISIMPWANGLVIREKDGSDSSIVRLRTGDAMRIAVDAIAPLIIEWALGEAVDWARSCSGESADAAADYIEDMRARGVKATSATASAFNMQDVARMAGLPTPETTGAPDDHQ